MRIQPQMVIPETVDSPLQCMNKNSFYHSKNWLEKDSLNWTETVSLLYVQSLAFFVFKDLELFMVKILRRTWNGIIGNGETFIPSIFIELESNSISFDCERTQLHGSSISYWRAARTWTTLCIDHLWTLRKTNLQYYLEFAVAQTKIHDQINTECI